MNLLSILSDPKALSAIVATLTTVLINLIFKVSQEKKILKINFSLNTKMNNKRKLKMRCLNTKFKYWKAVNF